MDTGKPAIKVAILDLYDGIPNKGISGFEDILSLYKTKRDLNLTWQVFDVRGKNELPGLEFDVYLSSGGPGSPFSADEAWDKNYFKLIEELAAYNAGNNGSKKHVLLVCHSFQLMCRQYQLGEVSLRDKPSFGVVPVCISAEKPDPLFKNLPNPFYAADSRSWQVVNPDLVAFEKTGATILAAESKRPAGLPPALMAIRFNKYFTGTQFHPEMGPEVMHTRLLMEDNKQQVIDERGEEVYQQMLAELYDEDKLALTFAVVIFNFLDEALPGG